MAFGVPGKGEARTALLAGTEAGAAGSIIKASGVGVKDRQRLIQRTAVYGPVRTVVWEGRSREAPPYPDLWHKDGVIGRPARRSLEILGAALQADGGTRSAFAASSIRRRSAAWTILPD